MPTELASDAVAWLEIEAMCSGLRKRDLKIAAQHYAAEIEEARSFEQEGKLLEALRRYQLIVRSYSDLVDTSEAKDHVERLESSKLVRAAEKTEKKLRSWETRTQSRFDTAYAELRELSTAPPAAHLRRMMGVATLEETALQTDAEGTVARRLLETLYAEISYYLTQEFFSEDRYGHARSVLQLAISIHDDRPLPWYNLACAHARLGDIDGAIEALEKTIENGLILVDFIENDCDLDSLREDSRFQQLVASLSKH
jgi:tetratricopeptide (TPR) repeat protein